MNPFTSSQEIFTRLKFIGKIQVGEKINTRNYLSVMEDGWLTSVIRRFYSFETRSDSLSFITDTINNALHIIDKIRQSESNNDKIILENMLKDLAQTIVGLKNLMRTYQDDLVFQCRLETTIQNIELCLRFFKEDYPFVETHINQKQTQ